MSDQMPMFDDPIPAEVPKPRKPRQKPTKRGAKVVDTKVVKKRRKRRARVKIAPTETIIRGHAGGRYSKDVYAAIGSLMGMKTSDRDIVLDIVQGLTNGRAD